MKQKAELSKKLTLQVSGSLKSSFLVSAILG
jgi:hypothetical protein